MLRNKTAWVAVDKDQLSYESNFNPQNVYHNGPRITTNPRADMPITPQSVNFVGNNHYTEND